MQAKRSIATLLPEKNSSNASATDALPLLMKSSTEAPQTASDTGHSLKTVSTMSDLSLESKMASREETSSGLKMSYSQMDIYLSRDNLVQKLLFAAVAGNGELVSRSTIVLGKTDEMGCPDEEFVSSFLIVFRRFETPYRYALMQVKNLVYD